MVAAVPAQYHHPVKTPANGFPRFVADCPRPEVDRPTLVVGSPMRVVKVAIAQVEDLDSARLYRVAAVMCRSVARFGLAAVA